MGGYEEMTGCQPLSSATSRNSKPQPSKLEFFVLEHPVIYRARLRAAPKDVGELQSPQLSPSVISEFFP
jgi:hypothetical protein